jgi:CRP/FNR family transcriptional regulator, cyclic AMP receptor protein
MQLKYLTPNDWALLKTISRRLVFKPREIIITINSRPNALFILAAGSAVVEVMRGTPIAKLVPGDVCGEMAFIESSAASASVVAESETTVDVLELPALTEVFTHHPHLEARFYRSLALLLSQRLRSTSLQLSKAATRPVTQ